MDYTKLSDQELLELLACTGRGSNSEFKIRTEISRRGLPQPRWPLARSGAPSKTTLPASSGTVGTIQGSTKQ